MPNLPRTLSLGLIAVAASTSTLAADPVTIGLITKTETNPFFVKMKEGADQAASAKGAKLLSGAGKTDGDNAGGHRHGK
jgi:fructose transport system substrate-binding protein